MPDVNLNAAVKFWSIFQLFYYLWKSPCEPFSVLRSAVLHDGDPALCRAHVYTFVRKSSSKGDYTVCSTADFCAAHFSLPSTLPNYSNGVSR